jgi:3-deoxy-8-phosphooctulonate synthase
MSVDPAPNPIVTVGTARFGNTLPLMLIAGPCALESREHALEMASALKEIAGKAGIGLVFKTSFDKANRTSAKSQRGVGLDRALPIFAEIRETLSVPVLTDVHEAQQCARVAGAVDVLQIPAFLCRQTDLLAAAAATGRVVNVKKGQFLAPWDMANVVAKLTSAGNRNVLVTERGASFGYNTLVSDMRALPILARSTGRASHLRCHAFRAAAGRARDLLRRRARICPGARARGGRRWRGRRLHRDAPESRPRPVGWSQHGAAQEHGASAAPLGRIRPTREERDIMH